MLIQNSRRICFLLGSLAIVIAPAGESFAIDGYDLPSRLSVNIGADEDGAREQSVDVLLNGLPFDASVSAGATNTQDSSSLLSDRSLEFDTEAVEFGVASSPLNIVEVGYDYSEWDSRDEFTIASHAPWLRFNAEEWSLSATVFRRDIDVRLVNRELVAVESDGYSFAFDWYGGDAFWLGASATTHDYSRDVSRINNIFVLIRLAPAARVFALGLEDRSYSVWAGGLAGDAIFDIAWRHGVSAVDDSVSDVVSATIEYALSETFSINALWGAQHSDNSERILFYGAGISIDW